jgi:hypothetical protein
MSPPPWDLASGDECIWRFANSETGTGLNEKSTWDHSKLLPCWESCHWYHMKLEHSFRGHAGKLCTCKDDQIWSKTNTSTVMIEHWWWSDRWHGQFLRKWRARLPVITLIFNQWWQQFEFTVQLTSSSSTPCCIIQSTSLTPWTCKATINFSLLKNHF